MAALVPVLKGIALLNDVKPEPMYKVRPDYTFAGCTPSWSVLSEPGSCYGLTPQDNAVIYKLNPLWSASISGPGQTVAVVEDTHTYDGKGGGTEWTLYRLDIGLGGCSATYTEVDPGCSDPSRNGDDGDVEMANGSAPSAAIVLISRASGRFALGGRIALKTLINASGPYPGVVS